jgi:hypothetical protein
MRVMTEPPSDIDLLDRVMEKGIVVEALDRLGLGAIDLSGVRITVSSIRLFTEGRNPPFRPSHFWKVEPS